MSRSSFVRQPLERVVARYDRLAHWYRYLEFTVLLAPGFRRRAITGIRLKPGEKVLEVGCGTGRNLALLHEAVGPSGCVIGVDASPGMLAESAQTVSQQGWANVRLIEADAATLALDEQVDAAYFSLSYSVMPDRPAVLAAAWRAVRPGGRLVIMDAGLPDNRLGRILGPFAEAIATTFPGDPYSEPWRDLERLSTPVRSERFRFGIYFVCAIDKAS
jgi:ubiquinone/menaquinone biosynthesis C-methylase UbiE